MNEQSADTLRKLAALRDEGVLTDDEFEKQKAACLSPPQAIRTRTNGLAVASLVLGIVWLGGLGSILAVILGFVARRQIRSSSPAQGGAGLALVGMILGIIGIVAVALALVLVLVGTFDNEAVAAQQEVKRAVNAVETCASQNGGTYDDCLDAQGVPSGVEVKGGEDWYIVTREGEGDVPMYAEGHDPDGGVERACKPEGPDCEGGTW